MKSEELKALIKLATPVALNAQVAAAEHVRDCERCRHLFEVAVEEIELSDNLIVSKRAVSKPVFRYDSNLAGIAIVSLVAEINLRHSQFQIQTLSPEPRQHHSLSYARMRSARRAIDCKRL